MDNANLQLKADGTDIRVSVLKGLAGIVPLAGGILAEALNAVPHQRFDRVVAFIEVLAGRVATLESEKAARINTPQGLDLLEDCGNQAARSMSDDRLRELATFMANALNDDELRYEQSKRLVTLFGQLTDFEVLILRGYAFSASEDSVFWDRHGSSLKVPSAHMGSSDAEIETQLIHNSHKQHLSQLGLLKPSFKSTGKGEVPDLDTGTGMLKAIGHQITPLGRLLLKSMGYDKPLERQSG